MSIKPFALERYFAKYEFSIQHQFSSSDCEGLFLQELLDRATPESLKLWTDLKLNYTESQGHPILRERISTMYKNVHPMELVIGVPEELIYITMNSILNPSDHLIVITPSYQSLFSVAEHLGCQYSEWRITEKDGKWSVDLSELEALLQKNTKLLVINFPNNPTGFLPSIDEFNKIIEFARRNNLIIFSDEMYRLLEYSENDRLPSVSDVYENGISLSGFSKTFALPGLRLGWISSKNSSFITQLIEYKDFTTICNSAPSEILGIMAIEAADSIVQRNLQIIQTNIMATQSLAEKYPKVFKWIAPNAGSIAFPKWLSNKDLGSVCDELVSAHKVMLVPGTLFNFQQPHFRAGLGRKGYIEALNIFENYISKM